MVNINKEMPLFAKLHKVNFLFDRISDQTLQEQFSITLTQYHVLISLHIGSCSSSDIAKYWGVSKPAISRQVEGLRVRKFLKRQENPTNRREQILAATKTGDTLFIKATALLENMFDELSKGLKGSEKKMLEKNLDILLSVLRQQSDAKNNTRKLK